MNEVVMRPLRFSADVPAMRAFLETLGLRSRIESERGGWVDMVGGSGMAALHDAASSSTGAKAGDTTLSFEADDIDELKDRLLAAGYPDVTIWDEAYGRVLSVTAADETVHYGPREAEFAVRLDLRTTESLPEVANRLTATGYESQSDEEGITVTDPDGQTIKVHA